MPFCKSQLPKLIAVAAFAGPALVFATSETPSLPVEQRCGKTADAEMVWVPGGSFIMGSDVAYPEEAPAREVTVAGFWMDRHELTNAEFVRFVGATGYKTLAERPPPAIHGASPDMMQPGSAVFTVPTHDDDRWWKWVVGANWRMPEGPKSSISGRDDYPVVQLAYEDVLAYARWADKALPSEEQWEYAARGGKIRQTYAWGEERDPGGVPQANYYQGVFPRKDLGIDGHIGRAPVGCYNANAFGLYDMIGNVWEWTSRAAGTGSEVRIIKGGSYLCAENYCRRYRPSARQLQEHDLGTNHIGVRFVKEG